MEVIYERCCGLDVHKKTVVACLRAPGGSRRQSEVRTFGTTTDELETLAEWLQRGGCTHAAIESTGVYWQPVFNVLEHVCTVVLVNAQHVKAVPGRKTDVRDAEWLAQLLEHGLLRPSFIPPLRIRELRELTRYRLTLKRTRADETNRVQKLLEGANIKLGNVATDVLGASGRAMCRALIAGETDPIRLAELAKGALRRKRPALLAALRGRFTPHHAVLLQMLLDHIDDLTRHIATCDAQIRACRGPFAAEVELLESIPGLSATTVETVIAEIGVDMGRFPTAAHLASWAGLCPGNHESAGRRQTGRIRPGNPWLRAALVQAAWAASRTSSTHLRRFHERIARRRGAKRATIAVAHRLLVAIWHILTRRTPYVDSGPTPKEDRTIAHLRRYYLRRLDHLGAGAAPAT